MKEVYSYIKPILITLIIVAVLQVTGLWSHVSSATQTMVLKTGALNADSEFKKPIGLFDYQFSMVDLNGNVKSAHELKGKVVFINVWATWCGPCKAEMPGIHELYKKLNNQPIEFVLLSVDKPNTKQKVSSYLNNNNFTFPVYMLNGPVPELLQVSSIPTTFIIDKHGNVVARETGARNYNTNKFLKSLTGLVSE